MFTREKVKVDLAKTNAKKGRKGKTSKAVWETLLASSSPNGTVGNERSPLRGSAEKRNGYSHVQWSDDEDDDDDEYDKYNTSITPNASRVHPMLWRLPFVKYTCSCSTITHNTLHIVAYDFTLL